MRDQTEPSIPVPDHLRLSFVVPVLNDAAGLKRCLDSLRTEGVPSKDAEVIVVDNGSSDTSREVARDAGARVLCLPGLTVAELRNRAAATSAGDVLAFVDADHEVLPGWCRAALDTLSAPDVAATGAAYSPPSAGPWVQAAYDAFREHHTRRTEVSWLGSGNLAVRASAFREVGGFDTTLVTCEDVDLCHRLRAAGYRILADPGLRSVHHGDPSTLRTLFRGELWRGRDNLRVSLRGRPAWRDVPSIAIPILDLAALCAVAVGLLSGHRLGLLLSGVGVLGLLGLSAVRALKMAHNSGRHEFMAATEMYVVAMVYDVARALALVARTGHRRKSPRIR